MDEILSQRNVFLSPKNIYSSYIIIIKCEDKNLTPTDILQMCDFLKSISITVSMRIFEIRIKVFMVS